METKTLDENFLSSINFFNWKVKINKKTKNIEDICSFDGYINILFDEFGIIYDWKWKLINISVDLLTTKSWRDGNKWVQRVEMFNNIDPLLSIDIRENKKDHKIIKLIEKQIDNLNNFLNNKKNTIKNIITLLKGSNPSGEIKNPKASEIQAVMGNQNINFALFFKENCYFKQNNEYDFEEYWLDSKEKNYFDLLKTINLNTPFNSNGINNSNLYDLLSITSNKNFKLYYAKWKINLKDNLKHNIKYIKQIDEEIKKARSRYYNSITKNYDDYKVWDIPQDDIDRAHIISVKYIRYMLIQTLYTNFKKYKETKPKYLSIISDPYNFLNLPNKIHRKFDLCKFNYNYESGEIDDNGAQILSEDGLLKNNGMYKSIPKHKLTPKRISYLKKRDKILNSNQKSTL